MSPDYASAPTTLVVVSYYDRRPVESLWRLFQSLRLFDFGRSLDICIIVNRTGSHEIVFPQSPQLIGVVERENLGMNIGAWDLGWRQFNSYHTYLFLQDDCYVVRKGWADALASAAEQVDTGLAGESLNLSWDKDWSQLRQSQLAASLPEHFVDGRVANRVDTYLDFFVREGIPAGNGGKHLRALVWAARRAVLERIGGFPIGRNYGECIAAEIGTSKRVESLGLAVRQVAAEPFRYVRHQEWNQDRPGGPFVHTAPPAHLFRAPPWACHQLSVGAIFQSVKRNELLNRLRHTVRGVLRRV